MERQWLIIPDYNNLEQSVELAKEYNAGFEYNDFFNPLVYSDEEEVKRRIHIYKQPDRDRSRDTLHGVFIDMAAASKDSYIRKYSRERMEQSLAIATELGVKGVVFHSGLIGELQLSSYIKDWADEQEVFIRKVLEKYPATEIYMENTFEKSPVALLQLKERLIDENRFRLCLDYGHACLSPTPIKEWIVKMAPFIGHMHVNDNDMHVDLHLVPGEGMIDFTECKRLLEENQINASILLEITGVEKQKRALACIGLI